MFGRLLSLYRIKEFSLSKIRYPYCERKRMKGYAFHPLLV